MVLLVAQPTISATVVTAIARQTRCFIPRFGTGHTRVPKSFESRCGFKLDGDLVTQSMLRDQMEIDSKILESYHRSDLAASRSNEKWRSEDGQ